MMVYVVKERTQICCYASDPATDKNATYLCGYDFYTRQYYSRNRKEITGFPACFANIVKSKISYQQSIPHLTWYIEYFHHCNGDRYRYYYCMPPIKEIEKLMSVGLIFDDYRPFTGVITLNKEIIEEIKENYSSVYNYEAADKIIMRKVSLDGLFEELKESFRCTFGSFLLHRVTAEQFPTIKKLAINFYNQAQRENLITPQYYSRLSKIVAEANISTPIEGLTKITDFADYNLLSLFSNLLLASYTNWHEFRIPDHNLVSEYYRWREIARIKAQENYAEDLKKNNDKTWLYWENDEYFARPLITPEDFHNEACYQHNCLESSYLAPTVNGRTHIVTIRKKTDSNVPLISCEVSNDGAIRQFLTRFNKGAYEEYQDVYHAYQMHLINSLKG